MFWQYAILSGGGVTRDRIQSKHLEPQIHSRSQFSLWIRQLDKLNKNSKKVKMDSSHVKTITVRNNLPWPQIKDEELYKEPLLKPGFDYDWFTRMSPGERLFHHQTLASIRKNRKMKQPLAPKDSLDLVMTTVYDQSADAFLEKSDIIRQPDTIGRPWYRLHRNVRVLPVPRPARDQLDDEIGIMPHSISMRPGTRFYGVKQGGNGVKMNPSSVKMGIASCHGYCTNPGYSRKIDGTFFQA